MKTSKTFKYLKTNDDLLPVDKLQPTKQVDISSKAMLNSLTMNDYTEKELIYKIKYEFDGEELKMAKDLLASKFGKKV
ncbi:MAG: hypothetical protein LBH55_02495 [Mycoplasmataceae bacterium]|jgi:hypothetical protein|nr:hypothetical protein [Mycoplasmataceae bacterium]